MSISRADLIRICCRRVKVTVRPDQLEQLGISADQLGTQIARLVEQNFASGRAERVQLHDVHQTSSIVEGLERYTDKVIGVYLQEHARVERLAESANAEWQRLFEWLARRAMSLLQRWPVGIARPQDEAADFAQQTCESIFRERFPYDVPFEAWATLILKNHVLQRYTRSRDLIYRQVVESLDRQNGQDAKNDDGLHDTLSDSSSHLDFENFDTREELLRAIAHLPTRAQREVVIYSFFYGRGDEEIAQQLGRTRQAIYNLRLRALRQLREILLKARAKDQEPDSH